MFSDLLNFFLLLFEQWSKLKSHISCCDDLTNLSNVGFKDGNPISYPMCWIFIITISGIENYFVDAAIRGKGYFSLKTFLYIISNWKPMLLLLDIRLPETGIRTKTPEEPIYFVKLLAKKFWSSWLRVILKVIAS